MKHSPELLVYKASAGSGKTFTLAVEYIKLLIQNPRAYRNILAVTFTNKATTEMKERILSQLYGIWIKDKDSDPYLQKITEELEMPPEDIRIRKITSAHIERVLEGIADNRTQVRNTKAYLLAALFNSVSTIDHYYTMQYNHDYRSP